MKNRALFDEYAAPILGHPLYQRTKLVFSHGTVTIYEHSLAVARRAFSKACGDPRYDLRVIVRAGLLHDFFLYEWHIPGLRYLKHGWVHPALAAIKAKEVFAINGHEEACIRTHMWPWTLFHIPASREAWAISLADKAVALEEAALRRGKRHTLRDPEADRV